MLHIIQLYVLYVIQVYIYAMLAVFMTSEQSIFNAGYSVQKTNTQNL